MKPESNIGALSFPLARAFATAAAAVVLLVPTLAPAQGAPAPAASATDLPAMAQVKGLFQAFVNGDDAGFLAFIHDHYPKTKTAPADWLDTRHELAKLQFHSVGPVSATEAHLVVFDPGMGAWADFSVRVDPATHAIVGFSLRPAPRPADVAAPPKLSGAALARDVRAKVEADAAADTFSGAVLVAQEGRPIFEAAYGAADRETKKPNTVETQFRFGSMGKMFTAVSIMQLAQAGKLDLNAPIGRYLTDYPNQDVATKVTINELLTHTGGTGDIFGPEFDAHRLTLRDPKDYVALYGARAPLFEPGSRPQYSNYGFMLLGRIVEAVSGLDYDTYIQRNIFQPAHMTSTGNQPETASLPNRANGYTLDGATLRNAADTFPVRGTPAGGGYSTTGDFLRFANALMSNKLLDAAHTTLLTTGGVKLPDGHEFPYDLSGPVGEGKRAIGHGGGAPGMNGELRIYPDGYTVVVLANRDPPVATALTNYIGERLP